MFSKIMPALSSNPFFSDASSDLQSRSSPCALSALRDKIFARSSKLYRIRNNRDNQCQGKSGFKKRRRGYKNIQCRTVTAAAAIFALCPENLPPSYVVIPPSKIEKGRGGDFKKMIIDALLKRQY
jgi:hypothetical protein